jgi:hypothetical protein
MKKYISFLLLLIPFLIQAQDPITSLNLTVDKSWSDPNVQWRAHGTAFYNYEGDLYTAAYVPVKVQDFPSEYTAYPYFYTCTASTSSAALAPLNMAGKNYIDYFGYLGEDGCEHEAKIMGKNFFFEYNEELWYYQHVHANYYNKNSKGLCDESYNCFAKMPEDASKKWETHITKFDPAMDYYPMGGVQFDSLLIVFAVDEQSNSSTYLQWYLQTYKFSNNTFVYVGYNHISTIPGDKFGGIIAREGNNGPMIILNTYNSSSHHAYLGMLLPDEMTTIGVMTFTYVPYTGVATLSNPGVTSIVSGSIRGCRASNYVDPYPTFSERMAMVTINNTSSNGNYVFNYMEYLISNDWLQPVTYGSLLAPSSLYPHKDDDEFNLEGAYGLVLGDFNDTIDGKDGYQKYDWLFFPNSSGKIAGVGLQSDKWLADPNSLVTSNDLADTTTYHQDIKSLWTLLGIVEGSPPAVIDWETWNHLHTFENKPTTLIMEKISTSDTNTTTTCNYGASFTQGADISMESKKIELGFGSKTKYSKDIQQKVSLGTAVKQVISQTFELDEYSQYYGAFIYGVPQITRFSYQVFPWYDNAYTHPVNNSLQYLFQIRGMSLRLEKVYFDQWPFNIPDPDADLLKYWTQAYRPNLANAVKGLSPVNVSWSDGFPGGDNYFKRGKDSTSTYGYDLGYEKEYSAGISIPKVFSIDISYGSDIKYSADVEVRTGYGNSIKSSLESMNQHDFGVEMTYLSVDSYLIKPENNSTGYLYDNLDGQKPWYIAHIVGVCENNIKLLTPVAGACLDPEELIFSWVSEKGPLSDYTLFINDAPYTSPTTTLISLETGNRTLTSLSGFVPEKGRTYYWQVRGTSPGGDYVWSKPGFFTVSCDENQIAQGKGMVAQVYPNPARSSDINIAVDSKAEGNITVLLINLNGTVVAKQESVNADGLPVNITFPGLDMSPGIYFAVIRSGEEQVVKKVMIR